MTQNLVKTFFTAIIGCVLRPQYIIVQRCFDSTPFDVEFGDMHDDLKVYARSGCGVPLHGYSWLLIFYGFSWLLILLGSLLG